MDSPRQPVPFRAGKKVFLCPHDPEFTDDMFRWINDPEATKGITITRPMSRGFERDYLSRSPKDSPNDIVFGIALVENKELIGTIGLHKINWVNRKAIAGIFIGAKEHWGKGYGTEAMMLLVEYAFNTLDLHKVGADVYDFNKRSIGHLENVGFTPEGTLKSDVFRDGQRHDVHVFGIFREQFLEKWNACMAESPK